MNSKNKILHWFFIAIAIFLAILAYVVYLHDKQNKSYKDIYVEFCDNGCAYIIPKDLKPKLIFDSSTSGQIINFYYSTNNKRASIWINRQSHKTEYLENLKKEISSKSPTPNKIYRSNYINENFKKYYFYFIKDNGRVVIFLDNSMTIEINTETEDHVRTSYLLPSEFISEIVSIDERVMQKINFLKVSSKHE